MLNPSLQAVFPLQKLYVHLKSSENLMKKSSRSRRTVALSDLLASVITIAITIIAGVSVFSFVNAQSSASSQSYGQSVGTYIEQIREKYVIVNAALNYPSANKITVWFYNYGEIDTQIIQLYIGTSESSLGNVSSSSLPLDLPRGSIKSITFDYTTTTGQVYYIKAVGVKGNTQTSFQVR